MLNQLGNYAMYLGTVVALIGGARIPPQWVLFIIGFVILMLGVALKHLGKSQVVLELRGSKMQEIAERLEAIRNELKAINSEKAQLSNEELHEKVEHLTAKTIYQFSLGLNTIKTSLGLKEYNNIMTSFAPGERYLNRVWSATTDGYHEEALNYLERAVPQIEEAHTKLQSYLNNK